MLAQPSACFCMWNTISWHNSKHDGSSTGAAEFSVQPCLQADWHDVCEECGAEAEASVISLSFCSLMTCMGCFSFWFFLPWRSRCFQRSWKFGIVFHEAADFQLNFFSPDRASGVREAFQADVEPQGEMVRMAEMGSPGCLVLPDCRWVCSLMMEDPHFFSLNLKFGQF